MLCLYSFPQQILRFFHTVEYITSYYYYFTVKKIHHCMAILPFLHSLVNRHRLFQLRTIMNKAAENKVYKYKLSKPNCPEYWF